MYIQSICLLSLLVLTSCTPVVSPNISTPLANDPKTSELYYNISRNLKVPSHAYITIHPLVYGQDEPLSSISRTNYSFYHSNQALPVTCCIEETCVRKTFNTYGIKLRFPDNILPDNTPKDFAHTSEEIQQWINHECK